MGPTSNGEEAEQHRSYRRKPQIRGSEGRTKVQDRAASGSGKARGESLKSRGAKEELN